jgi:hypothetical protein
MEDSIKKIIVDIKEKPKNKTKTNRLITRENVWNYDNINYEDEFKILNDLKNNIINDDTNLLKNEIKKKLSGYKSQDVKKNKYNPQKIINIDQTLKKLIDCGCKCLYCNGNSKIFYKYVRDINQWSLDRIDNNYGHNFDNVEISCLKCNLRRKTISLDKYMLTHQINTIKKIK